MLNFLKLCFTSVAIIINVYHIECNLQDLEYGKNFSTSQEAWQNYEVFLRVKVNFRRANRCTIDDTTIENLSQYGFLGELIKY